MSSTQAASTTEPSHTEPIRSEPAHGDAAQGEPVQGESDAAESMEAEGLLENLEKFSEIPLGRILQATVVKITDTDVLVDVGLKSEGSIPRAEFLHPDGTLTVAAGDAVDVWLESYDEGAGTMSLSRERAARLRLWEEIDRAFREQKSLKGKVVERVKGGLIVDIGVRAFMPGSHADLRPLRNLEPLLGQEISCKVIKVLRKRNNVVVSRKLALEEEAAGRKAQLLERLSEGVELEGRVKNLTDYGAFVDLGGMDGLVHITDLAWGRIAHPSEIVRVGQEVRVKVLKLDAAKGRVSLGLKQLQPDPWEQVPSTFKPGDRWTGRVVSVTDYGAFVELLPGVEGLIHVSEMSWSRRQKHPSKVVKPGDRAEVAILDVNAAQRRISLSLRQSLPDPWATFPERVKAGDQVEATVRNFADFGAFAEVEEGIDGLIHLSDISWTRNAKHPSEILKRGQKVKAVVLSLDAEHRRLSLGLKQSEPDPWQNFEGACKPGDLVRGKVARLAGFGAFVELEGGVEGLCHVSEMEEAGDGAPKLEVGSEREFRVLRVSASDHKIGLSLKRAAAEPAPPQEPAPKPPATAMAEALASAGVIPSDSPAAAAGESEERAAVAGGRTRA